MQADSPSDVLASLRAAYAELLAAGAPFPEVVRAGREQAGVAVPAAAQAVGVARATWYRWEAGAGEPSEAVREALGWPEGAIMPGDARTPMGARTEPAAMLEAARCVREQPYAHAAGLPRLVVATGHRAVTIRPADGVVAHRLCSVRLASARVQEGTATGADRALLAGNDDDTILALALGGALERMRAAGFDEDTVRMVGAVAYVWTTGGLGEARRHWARLKTRKDAVARRLAS